MGRVSVAGEIIREACASMGLPIKELRTNGEVAAAMWFYLYQVEGWEARGIGRLWKINPAIVLDGVHRIWDRIEEAVGGCNLCRARLDAVGLGCWADDLKRTREAVVWGGRKPTREKRRAAVKRVREAVA
jgi:hypothetical protein